VYYTQLNRNPLTIYTKAHNPYANTFVLKTYLRKEADAKKYYENEVNAFKRLRQSPNMIRCFGSFTQGDRLNILFEYADKDTLENYFKTISAPTKGEDIIKFWEGLFLIIEALMKVHEGTVPLPQDGQIHPLHGYVHGSSCFI